eukprot:GHUV01047520.1.p1 GENE.GHUV01047520.1~~GHUV01047520.1.p1  ORF type:complete len:226 (+),score=37.78 GHUV01047520.1:251-928(+)
MRQVQCRCNSNGQQLQGRFAPGLARTFHHARQNRFLVRFHCKQAGLVCSATSSEQATSSTTISTAAEEAGVEASTSGRGSEWESKTLDGDLGHECSFYDWKWGSRVNYIRAGRTGPPLLLCHGFGVGAYHFERNIPELAKHHRVGCNSIHGTSCRRGLNGKLCCRFNWAAAHVSSDPKAIEYLRWQPPCAWPPGPPVQLWRSSQQRVGISNLVLPVRLTQQQQLC